MLLDPHHLQHNLDRIEEIERASLRHVVQALYDYRQTAREVFHAEIDLVADVGEDITREALDRREWLGLINDSSARWITSEPAICFTPTMR